ncbi:MAG: late competence development ComFB family protein [Bacillota bacterium]
MSESVFLKNCMEEYVWEFLDEVLKRYPEICQCNLCKYDIAAMTLNHLPPKYAVREKGEIFAKTMILQDQYRTDIYTAIHRAIIEVREKPRHYA